MNWDKATILELCHIIMYDEQATDEDRRAAGVELFNQIGVDGRAV